MARTDYAQGGGQNGQEGGTEREPLVFSADSGGAITVPGSDFIANAEILRDGQDLILQGPDGAVVIIEAYFLAEPPPVITCAQGAVLTPELVESFVHHAGAVHHAQAASMTDVSPVGWVKEVSGQATITRTDGTKETITIGTAVYKGDVVETEGKGAVNIAFSDETTMAVSENARMAIDNYEFDPHSESGATNFSVLRGVFVFVSGAIGRSDPDDVHINTPSGSIGIRGTTIAGNVTTGEITVIEGAIVLQAPNGQQITLANQFETARLSDGGVVAVGVVSSGDVANNFSALGGVMPSFFTSINETPAGDDGAGGNAPGEGPAPADQLAPASGAADTFDAFGDDIFGDDNMFSDATPTEADSLLDGFSLDSSGSGDLGFGDLFFGTDAGSDGGDAFLSEGDDTGSEESGSEESIAEPPPPPPAVEPPPVPDFSGDLTFNVNENNVGGDLVGTIVPGGTGPFTFVLTDPSSLFALDSAGVLTVIAASTLDREVNDQYTVTVDISDGFYTDTITITIDINDLNDNAPTLSAGSFSIDEDAINGDSPGFVTASDPDTVGTLTYSITGGTGAGLFGINSSTGEVTLTGGSLDYEVLASYSLNIQVSDGVNAAASATFTVNVNDVDEAPVLVDQSLTVAEGATIVLTNATLEATDVDTTNPNIVFTVEGVAAHGTLRLSGVTLGVSDTFTMQDVLNGDVDYIHDGGETLSDAFDFSLSDGTTTTTGQTFSITITPINDAPVLDNAGTPAITDVLEDDVLSAGDTVASLVNGLITDAEGVDTSIAVTAVDNSNGAWKYSLDGGISWNAMPAVSPGAALLLGAADMLRFEPNADFIGTASFTFKAWDESTGTAGTSVDTTVGTAFSSLSESVSVTVTPVDDAPVIATNAGLMVQQHLLGDGIILTPAMLDVTDVDTTDAGLVYTVTGGLAEGQLELVSNPGNPITSFTQADIASGQVVYVPLMLDPDVAADSFDFEVSDGTTTLATATFLIDYGALGNDTVASLPNNAVYYGGAGDDTITATGTLVTVWGGADDDTITIAGANGVADGGIGMDTLTAAGANAAIHGGADNDTIYITGLGAQIFAGSGNDDIYLNAASVDYVIGDTGIDTLHMTTAGTYDTIADFNAVSDIEIIDFNSGSTLTLHLTTDWLTNDTGDLSILMNNAGAQTLFLDFSTWDGLGNFEITSGSFATRDAVFTNNITGDTVTLDWEGVDTVSIINPLNLNNALGAAGFTITDDIAMGFGTSAAFFDRDGDGYDDLTIVRDKGNLVFMVGGDSLPIADITVGGGGVDDIPFSSSVSAAIAGNPDDRMISSIGDFNGDGVGDFLFAAPLADDANGTSSTGQVAIVDGATGDWIAHLDGLAVGDLAGYSISGIGDVNRDGFDDVIIGAPGADGGGIDAGKAYVLMGGMYAPNSTIDLSTMNQPQQRGDMTSGHFSGALDIEMVKSASMGTIAYVLESGNVKAIDLTDPAAPVTVSGSALNNAVVNALGGYTAAGGGTDAMTSAVDIVVKGDFLYVLSNNVGGTQGQITVFDISDPSTPVFVDLMKDASFKFSSAIDVDPGNGKLVMTISNGASSQLIEIATLPNGNIGNATVGAYAIVGNSAAAPNLNGASEVILNGNYAYVATVNSGNIHVVDLTASPTVMGGAAQAFANVSNLFLDKAANRLYAISDDGGATGTIKVYNVATPNAPSFLGTLTLGSLDGATDIVVMGDRAYITTPSGVQVVNVSNPGTMSVIGPLPNGGGMAANGAALALDDHGGLHVVTNGGQNTLVNYDLAPRGFAVSGPGANAELGTDVMSAGDFNGDGYLDFMYSIPGAGGGPGYVGIELGPNPALGAGPHVITIGSTASNFAVDATDNEIPMAYLGDINGDGVSDLAMASIAGDGELYLFTGSNIDYAGNTFPALVTANGFGVAGAATIIDPSAAGYKLIGGGAAGDFNGDGYDDIAFALQDNALPEDLDIYVLFGRNSADWTAFNAAATADLMNALNNPNNAFHITYTVPMGGDPYNFDVILSSGGDMNGDGFGELYIGLPNMDNDPFTDSDLDLIDDNDSDGTAYVVYGREAGPATINTSLTATNFNQSLVGDDGINILDTDNGNSYTGGVSVHAGAGDDVINIATTTFRLIDGGTGFDTMKFDEASLDFSAVGHERFSGIEKIDMFGVGQTMTLTLNNIFSLLGSSDDSTLHISSSGSPGNQLDINDMGGGSIAAANAQDVAMILHADSWGASGSVYDFQIGGQTLKIDQVLIDSGGVGIV